MIHCECSFTGGGWLKKSCQFHEAQRKDAERYRWLVERRISGAGLPSLATYTGTGALVSWDAHSQDTDAAIDAEMQSATNLKGAE